MSLKTAYKMTFILQSHNQKVSWSINMHNKLVQNREIILCSLSHILGDHFVGVHLIFVTSYKFVYAICICCRRSNFKQRFRDHNYYKFLCSSKYKIYLAVYINIFKTVIVAIYRNWILICSNAALLIIIAI